MIWLMRKMNEEETERIEKIQKEERERLLKKIKTEKDFEKWKEEWKEKVPMCKDFRCVHELDSCGIYIMCGDCSIFRTFKNGLWGWICDNADCIDCVRRYKCRKTDNGKEHHKRRVKK